MQSDIITAQDLEEINYYFGSVDELDYDDYKKKKKELQLKYHPDSFEKYKDDIVLEMANRTFQKVQLLSSKLELLLNKKFNPETSSEDWNSSRAFFAIEKMKVEVITGNKDLKYHLFGSKYRWLAYGESFTIPKTKAKIIIDEGHQGNRIGFKETIRMYLTFGPEDSVELISLWFYSNLLKNASNMIIDGKRMDIDLLQINQAIKRTAFKGIAAPEE